MKKFYKNRYVIALYSLDGEEFIMQFDNVRQMLEYKGEKITEQNIRRMCVILTRALRKNGVIHFIRKRPTRVYLIDMEDDDCE